MSRIGKLPVNLPAGVTVEVAADNTVSVKGPLGTLSQKVDSDIKVEVGTHTDVHTGKEVPAVLVTRPTNQPRHRSMHGLYRALIQNMVVGVSKGYEIKQELVGVGFKAEVKGQVLEMSLGYSHDTHFLLPKEVTATAVTEKKGQPDRDAQERRQAAHRPGGRQAPLAAQAGAVQGQGYQVRRRADPSQGRQIRRC